MVGCSRASRRRLCLSAGCLTVIGVGRSGAPQVGWLREFSEPAVNQALAQAIPGFDARRVTIEPATSFDHPAWASARAVIDGRVYAKVAFSEATAVRIWREAQVLTFLREQVGLPVPNVIACGSAPAVVATEAVRDAAPLPYSTVARMQPAEIDIVAGELARFLATLHADSTRKLARAHVDQLPRLPDPSLHVCTETLRTDFVQLVDPRRQNQVLEWCDWIDAQLTPPVEAVLVHGDFHPYNQLWQPHEHHLAAVLDFEGCGLAEPEFDFCVLPVFGPGVKLLTATVNQYEPTSGRRLSLPRIMALHLLNTLGDALWRTQAGIPLPAPGSTSDAYITEAASRLTELNLGP